MNRRAYLALLALVLLATLLRLHQLDWQDFWGDEAFSISLSQRPLEEVIAGAADTHPPFYPFLLFFWLRLAGSNPFATRALAAFAGILIVPLVFVFARRLVPTRPRVAWFAAALTCISPMLIYYSQETRMYEQVTLFSLASAYFAVRFFPSQSVQPFRAHRNVSASYVLTSLGALYTHYSGFFVLAAENAYFLLDVWRRRRRGESVPLAPWLYMQGILFAAYVPWIVAQNSFLRGKASARLDEWSWRGMEMIFGKTLLAFSAGLTVDYPVAQIAGLVFLCVAVIGTIVALWSWSDSPSVLAPLVFFLPLLIAWVIDPFMPFFFERYVLVALPAFYVTVAVGWDALARRVSRGAIAVGAALLMVALIALPNYYYDDAYAKGKYGRMMAFIASQSQPGDALVLNNPLQKPLFDYYHPNGIPAYYLPDGAPLEDPTTRARLDQIARQSTRIWLVMFGNPAEYDPTGYLARWLGANSFKTFERGFVDASLSLYVMPNSGRSIRGSVYARLGEVIELTGFDLDRTDAVGGQTLQLTLHWKSIAPTTKAYKVFTHLIGEINPERRSPVWAQMDGEPVGGSRPTMTWTVGEGIDDAYGLQLPADIPPDEYQLEVGMYDPVTLARLEVRDANGTRMPDDRILLGTVRIR